MKRVLGFLFFFAFLWSSAQHTNKPITELLREDLKQAVLVDVRTPQEFISGHLKSAININWFDADFAKKFDTIPKQRTIYVYCKKGGRSAKAARLLDSLGYGVVDLRGGYDTWRENQQ